MLLTAFSFLRAGTPFLVLVVTSLVVVARFSMLSLSIAPYFEGLSTRWKWALAYFLWTPTYALAVERYETEPSTSRRGYWLGTATPLWVSVQVGVVVGVVFGARVPAAWQLDFVIPLAFVALLRGFLRDRPTVATALVFVGIFTRGGGVTLDPARLLAGVSAVVVAWRTRSILATIVVGMGVLWGVTLLVG